MWAHAEDLDTLEFALMQVTSYIAGPVGFLVTLLWCFSYLLIQTRLSM